MAYAHTVWSKPGRPDEVAETIDEAVRLQYEGWISAGSAPVRDALDYPATKRYVQEELEGLSVGGGTGLTSEQLAKLNGIEAQATKNATDAALRARSSHQGTQPISSVDNLQLTLDGLLPKPAGNTSQYVRGDGSLANLNQFSVGLGNVGNVSPADLRARASHTGVQPSSTISDFQEAVEDAVAAFLGRSTHTGITFTYDDAGNALGATVTGAGGGSFDAEAARDTLGLALVGLGNISIFVDDAGDQIRISTTATVNDTDANLRARGSHTGTQPADTITETSAVKMLTAAERTKLAGVATNATANATDASLRDASQLTGLVNIARLTADLPLVAPFDAAARPTSDTSKVVLIIGGTTPPSWAVLGKDIQFASA